MPIVWAFIVSFIMGDGTRQWYFSDNYESEAACTMQRNVSEALYKKLPQRVLVTNCMKMDAIRGVEVEDVLE